MSDKQARLVKRECNPRTCGTYEIWDVDDGNGIFVDYNPFTWDTLMPETMAFPYDLRSKEVTSWEELDVWYGDATGGEAMRDLGYEPVEEGDHV